MNSDTLIYDHIDIVLALCAQHRSLLSNFFTKQYFFLNSNPDFHYFSKNVNGPSCWMGISGQNNLCNSIHQKKLWQSVKKQRNFLWIFPQTSRNFSSYKIKYQVAKQRFEIPVSGKLDICETQSWNSLVSISQHHTE